MKLAFLFDPRAVRISFSPNDIFTSSRGLTGSEIAFFRFATGLSDLGHDVTIYSKFTAPGYINKTKCKEYSTWMVDSCTEKFDAAVANTIADPLQYLKDDTFCFLNHQCNGFSTSTAGWESYVDILAPLSNTHAVHLLPESIFPKEKYRILHNGVDTSQFYPEKKEPGKIIWASSLDRGLHWLLEMFPKIRKHVPEASLHIFYDFHSIEYMSGLYMPGGHPNFDNHHFELGTRSRYILEAVKKLDGKGVFAHKSVSRQRIETEMRNSISLVYPLDVVYFTETFGVVVLEACASGTVPVLCKGDAFNELWGEVSDGVLPPFREHKDEFLDKTVHILKDAPYRGEMMKKCVEHAKKFEWKILTKNLEKCLLTRGDEGLPMVDWTTPL